MRICPRCNQNTMEDISVLNSMSLESKNSEDPSYDICRPCGKEDYRKEKEEREKYYQETHGVSLREDELRYEAYTLGIKNVGIYPFEMLEDMVKEEKKRKAEYRRGVWSKSEKPKKTPTFDSVVGVSDGKKAIIDSIIRPLQRPDLYPLGWNRCILLFGPPGTGKTLLASQSAREIDAEFIEKDAAQIKSKWIGESEQNVARLFNEARNKFKYLKSKRPIIIFIDEIDALFGRAVEGSCDYDVEMRNQFLKELDGLGDKENNIPLYVIGSTNKPWNLDFAFVRRFQKRVHIGMPNQQDRIEMLNLYTKGLNLSTSIDLGVLADYCEGYSGSDIKDVCRDAYQITIDKVFESDIHTIPDALPSLGDYTELKTPDAISQQDFVNAFERRSASVSKNVLSQIEEWNKIHRAN